MNQISKFPWLALASCAFLSSCAFSPTIGFSIPIGGFGSVGVSVGANGRVGGSLGVGIGGGFVKVGTSVQLPPAKKVEEESAKN